MIFHIALRADWLAAQKTGQYRPASQDREAFIHCSTESQIVQVANAFYHGKNDLLLLIIDETRLQAELRWEAMAGPLAEGLSADEQFPHVYGPLNLAAVVRILPFEPDMAGRFSLPPIHE